MLLPKADRPDTLVVGPYSDLLVIYSNWRVATDSRRHAAWKLGEQSNLIRVQDEKIALLERQYKDAMTRGDTALDELGERNMELMKCGQKNERLKSREKLYIGGAAVAVGIILLKTLAP